MAGDGQVPLASNESQLPHVHGAQVCLQLTELQQCGVCVSAEGDHEAPPGLTVLAKEVRGGIREQAILVLAKVIRPKPMQNEGLHVGWLYCGICAAQLGMHAVHRWPGVGERLQRTCTLPMLSTCLTPYTERPLTGRNSVDLWDLMTPGRRPCSHSALPDLSKGLPWKGRWSLGKRDCPSTSASDPGCSSRDAPSALVARLSGTDVRWLRSLMRSLPNWGTVLSIPILSVPLRINQCKTSSNNAKHNSSKFNLFRMHRN